MNWLSPQSYDDRDLARTIGNLDGFFNQLLSSDGRGLIPSEPSSAVVGRVTASLRELGLDPTGSFASQCERLSASPTASAGWRASAEPLLTSAFAEWSSVAARMRADRSATAAGTVAGLFTSSGGVPKKPVTSASVGIRGIEGDHQRSRQHHGRPWQALCIWSRETVERLQAEGHPIGPGFAGENILLSGVDFASVVAGARLRIGSMIADITLTALPCWKNAPWFVDGNFNRMHHSVEPGISRVYAAVIEPGTIAVGDKFTVELR